MTNRVKSVMGPIDWEDSEPIVSPSIGPGGAFTPIEPSELPARTSRAGFEYVLGEKLKQGTADVAQLLLLPFRIPTFESEPFATKLSQRIPSLLGVAELGRSEDVFQRVVGEGTRALPVTLLPGPKGASLFSRSPKASGEAVTTAFGAGAGFELGRTAAEGSPLETPAAIAGALSAGSASSILYNALAGAFSSTGRAFIGKLKGQVKEAVGDENFNKMVNAVNADQVQRLLVENPDLLNKLSRVQEIQQLIPGFNPNLFQATGATTASIRAQSALQRQVARIPEVEQQTAKSMDAVRQRVADLFPASESSFTFAGRQMDRTKTALASLVKNADDNIENLSKTFVKTGRQDLGDQIRKAYEGRREAVRKVFNDQYSALDSQADSVGARLSPQQTQNIFNTVQSNREVFESSPELFSVIQSTLKPKQVTQGSPLLGPTGAPLTPQTTTLEFDPVNFADLRSLSRRVNADLFSSQQAAAANVPGAGQKAFVLSQLKNQIEESIETLPKEISSKFKAINAAYDDQYREVFRKGLGGLVGAKTRMGERVKDEDIINYLTKESNVDDFYRIFGRSEDTENFLKTGLIEKFLSQPNSVDANGMLNQTALTSFVRKNEGVIDKVPALKSFLANAERNMESFALQRGSAIKGVQALERSSLSAISKKQNIDQVLTTNQSGAFQDLTKLSQLVAASKADPTGRALKGLQGLMIEKALDAADPVKFMETNKRAFTRAFGDDFTTVQKFAEAGQMLARSFPIKPPVQILEGDVLQRAIGTGGAGIGSLIRDRISSVQYKAAILLSRFTQQKGVAAKDNAFIEVFKNPDLVKEATKNINILNSKAASDKAKEVAVSGLYRVLIKAGVNTYRSGLVAGTGLMAEQRREEQQQQGLEQPVEIPEF